MELYRERAQFPYRYNFDQDLEYFDPFYRDNYFFDSYYFNLLKLRRRRMEEIIQEEENKIILQPTVEENE